MVESQGLTLIGFAVTNLDDDAAIQLTFPFDRLTAATPGHRALATAIDTALDSALDAVRERFGSSAVTRAVLLGQEEGISVPLLPD
jgi:DNA polymerase-4